jgi:excisionase family DNA binding protein
MKSRKSVQDQADTLGTKAADKPVAGADSICRTLSVEDAGRILGISRGAAYAHAKAGAIPTIKLGKRVLVPKAAFEKLLQGA